MTNIRDDVSMPESIDQLEQTSSWKGDRRTIGLGAAALVAIGASAATAIFVRRRTQARVQRLEWLAMQASAVRGAMPSARQAAPFGGAGGALLMSALLLARARRAQSNSRLDELHHRLAELETRMPSDRPRPRDLLIGAGVALGLARLVARVARRPAESAS